ncbi:MAG: glycosyltransferase family 4 protein [Candidatus Hatepunaea meridiana]|nr:glycosyltransferase family 4 protein [Candidatus Hatepunaea meridiana]
MRVIIAVAHGGIYSGGAHQALYALRGLKRAGVEVMAVWGPDVDGDPHGLDRLKDLDISLEIIPMNDTLNLSTLKQFRKILNEFKPDVVECFKSGAQYHALFGGIGLNQHAIIFYRGISRNMDVWQGLKYRLRRVDRIIANCEDLKWIMSKTGKIPPEKIDFVHGEFDPAFSNPDSVDGSGFRNELNIPEDVMLITQLGNWSEWRGQGVTLKAAAILKEKGYRFHLLFCGRETDKLRDQVDNLALSDVVTLSLYRRDPERVLKATNIAVNASTSHESLPGSLINIIAMGIPAIASDVPGSNMIVRDGVNGYIIQPGDSDLLAQSLMKLLNMDESKLNEMSKAARQRALDLFSSDIRTSCRLKVYERAIEHRRQ